MRAFEMTGTVAAAQVAMSAAIMGSMERAAATRAQAAHCSNVRSLAARVATLEAQLASARREVADYEAEVISLGDAAVTMARSLRAIGRPDLVIAA